MDIAEGKKYFPKVWSLVPESLSNEDLFINPFYGGDLRDCAEFQTGTGKDQVGEVVLFVDDEEIIRFFEQTAELYLYGAYNQVNVCQMRVRGTVKPEEDHAETERIRCRLKEVIRSRVGKQVNGLERDEAEDRYVILEKGRPFRFSPISYAYDTYERG
ncbi:MAG TPA: hypothetical protein VN420_05190 [Candidatus Fimivivens sp.]|nr:hypothetical protein [Candidatus Fimivivens sp.]